MTGGVSLAIFPENPSAELNEGNGTPFAVVSLCDLHPARVTAHVRTEDEADALIAAFTKAKFLLAAVEAAQCSKEGVPSE